jgi:hypothetical protein
LALVCGALALAPGGSQELTVTGGDGQTATDRGTVTVTR